MRQKFELRVIIGALIWLGLIAGAILLFNRATPGDLKIPTQLGNYFGQQRRTITMRSAYNDVFGIGDPIFLEVDGNVTPVGVVADLGLDDRKDKHQRNFKQAFQQTATVELYGNAPQLVPGDYFTQHSTDDSMAWVINTMFPPEMKEKISGLILNAYQSNQADLMEVFRPVVEQSLVDATGIIREDLKEAIENHRVEIDKISARFQSDLLEKEIIPLVQEEIWPIVAAESRPLATQVGQEIWQEVSVWRFGWRYLYDRSPLPEKQLSEKEFNRFVDNKAIPILESHINDFIDLQQRLLSGISKNEKVKSTVSASIRKIAEDEEVQALVSQIFRETVIDNDRLKESLEKNWNSAQAKRAMNLANNRLEPTVRTIGETIFGSTQTQITPEFARVLRNRVMHKDERWFTLHTSASGNRNEELAQQLIDSGRAADTASGSLQQTIPVVPSYEYKNIPNFAPELEAQN